MTVTKIYKRQCHHWHVPGKFKLRPELISSSRDLSHTIISFEKGEMGGVSRQFWGVVVGEESVFGVRFAVQTDLKKFLRRVC